MSTLTSLGGVGAGLSQAQFQMEYQARLLKEQQNVSATLGTIALDLIRRVTDVAHSGVERHDLDVQA